MKDQYFGDIGDYGKYGLLRFLRDRGLSIGANWYLTENDERGDGGHTEYLAREGMREYDEELFDFLRPVADMDKDSKRVSDIERSGLLRGITFYSKRMELESIANFRERGEKRNSWHSDALNTLSAPELIFADPDNGLSMTKKAWHKGAEKFILPCEIEDYFKCGKQVVYYHHRPRKKGEDWMRDKRMILNTIPEAKLLALSFNRWSCRTYIFVLHAEQYERYRCILTDFMKTNWGRLEVGGKRAFTDEEI